MLFSSQGSKSRVTFVSEEVLVDGDTLFVEHLSKYLGSIQVHVSLHSGQVQKVVRVHVLEAVHVVEEELEGLVHVLLGDVRHVSLKPLAKLRHWPPDAPLVPGLLIQPRVQEEVEGVKESLVLVCAHYDGLRVDLAIRDHVMRKSRQHGAVEDGLGRIKEHIIIEFQDASNVHILVRIVKIRMLGT